MAWEEWKRQGEDVASAWFWAQGEFSRHIIPAAALPGVAAHPTATQEPPHRAAAAGESVHAPEDVPSQGPWGLGVGQDLSPACSEMHCAGSALRSTL